jgi:hypothetical protein
MLTKTDIQVISNVIAEALVELNYRYVAAIKGNNARKLESHGYVEVLGKIKKCGDIQFDLHFKDIDDGTRKHDELIAGVYKWWK